ncbi:MAG TPA: DUF1178 family protein [Thermohalobaculum sp.]|nr:DUF1178 family protein [Thermohalobaculum sp.]
MIRYALRCVDGHDFDGWFRDSAAFEAQAEAGRVACAVCGSAEVGKALMAPSVPSAREARPRLAPAGPREKALAALRQKIERECDYVGRDFAAEARRMHEGDTDRRAVWGEANLREARSLREEGVPILPLPFMHRRDD